jgi:hypothetical protein
MATRKTRKTEPKFISEMAADDYAFALAQKLGYVIDDSEADQGRGVIAYTTEHGQTFEVYVGLDNRLHHRFYGVNGDAI